MPPAAPRKTMSKTATPESVGSGALVRPFEVGDVVDYRNHLMGYSIFPLAVMQVTDGLVIAKNEEGRRFEFRPDGISTWSNNLSIRHWPNTQVQPR